jgi:RNA-binding protein
MSRAFPKLGGADRRHLRGLAHGLDPVVRVGAAGLTPSIVRAVDRALEDHELIKIRIPAEREQRREIAEAVSRETRSVLAGQVGQVAILYRRARDAERRRITLPSAGG